MTTMNRPFAADGGMFAAAAQISQPAAVQAWRHLPAARTFADHARINNARQDRDDPKDSGAAGAE
jgi:hypothetical protein